MFIVLNCNCDLLLIGSVLAAWQSCRRTRESRLTGFWGYFFRERNFRVTVSMKTTAVEIKSTWFGFAVPPDREIMNKDSCQKSFLNVYSHTLLGPICFLPNKNGRLACLVTLCKFSLEDYWKWSGMHPIVVESNSTFRKDWKKVGLASKKSFLIGALTSLALCLLLLLASDAFAMSIFNVSWLRPKNFRRILIWHVPNACLRMYYGPKIFHSA